MTQQRAAHIVPLPTSSGNISGLTTKADQLIEVAGFSAEETAGHAVTATVRSGGSSGPPIWSSGSLSSSATQFGYAVPILVSAPLYCTVTGTGTLNGIVHVL